MSAICLTLPPPQPDDRRCILLVEDHDHVRASLRDWLSALLPGYVYLEAASGEQAILLAAAHRPCLVIADIGLPGVSGLEAARAMLAEQPSLQIIMLSIHDEAQYRDDAARVGVRAFVSKSHMRTQLPPALVQALSAAG